jgi:flagellum-specific peptidoglycan hydrolase FlgJ
MKVIPKLQQGNTIESDNTKVVRPEIHEPIKAKPRQYSIVDLGGEPSNDTRSAAERNRDYWHPIKGAKARFRASMSNETNPLVGIERTILPSAAGAALVTTPAAVVGGALGNMTVDKLTGGWGNWLEDKTGIPSEIGVYTNPGAWYGGAKGYKIGKDKLITKSIKGDADLAWNPINKNHWIFNKEARTPSNIAMATANRITPFLSKVEKLPLKVAAYKAAKRTNGNASVSLQDIKTMPADYTGSSILGGGNLEGRNLLAKYIFDENPVVKRMFFNKATSNIKPISRNEARRGFSHGDRYEQLYPGVHNRRYEMSAVVPSGRPLKFQEASEFTEYAGKNPIGKIIGKEAEPVMRMGDKEFMTFRQPGTDYIGPIDDVAGHLVKFQMNKGKLRQTSQDMWKFNPADYAKRWNDSPNTANQVRLIKQAALMDKVGRPFILQQSNPIWIEGKSVRNPELVTMAHGGRFDFKKSPLLKKQEEINGKRDMRKKFVKSSRPTYKKRIRKGQTGMKFASYNVVETPRVELTDITNPINPFSEYNYNTTYDKPTALVIPTREDSKPDTNETDVVANNPTVEPVINKSVASKPVTKTVSSTWKSPYTNRRQWTTELINAYKKAGITNDNAIRMLLAQDALESSWGKSAQGKYNFGNLTTGSSWKGNYVTGNDKNAKGEAIKQKFRSYNSMDEYAADKIQFLKRLYDFDENDDINKFVAKLTGSNKGKRRYAEATNYAKVLTGVYNGIPKGENGMIIKYQEPAQPIARRDATYVAPKMYAPRPYKTKEEEIIEQNRNSEMISIPAHSTIGMVDGKLQVIDTPARQITNVGAGYLSGTDPVGEFVVGNVVAGKPLMWLGKGVEYGAARVGSQLARARIISKTIDKGTPSVEPLPNNVGWGPRQSIHVVHDKNSARLPKLYFPERWDAIHEGAPEAGIWYQGKFGNPRTAANHSIPGKAEKAAKARERFAKRPYRVEGDLELERPIVTVGDVADRAALERAADKMSADGVIFNNVYDNGYSNNQVIFSLRDDLKNGTMTHKLTGKVVIPTENNPYPKIGTATMVDGSLKPTGDIFGELLPTQGTKHVVFKHKTDPTKVVKVYKPTEGGYKTLDELREGLRMYRARDEVPGAVPTELQGYLQGENGMYPVFTQTKVGPIKKMSVLDELARMFEAKGWTRINDSSYKNSKITVGDITTENVGMLNGKPVIFDPEAAYNEDIIKVSNAKFKNK